jgi:hypothetical protein
VTLGVVNLKASFGLIPDVRNAAFVEHQITGRVVYLHPNLVAVAGCGYDLHLDTVPDTPFEADITDGLGISTVRAIPVDG